MTTEDTAQVDESVLTETPEVTQATDTTEEIKPEAQPEETKPPETTESAGKTYTEDDVRKQISDYESRAQSERAQHQQQLDLLALQRQFENMQAEENTAKNHDNEAVTSGEITQEEANQRAADRQKYNQLRLVTARQQSELAAITQQAEQVAYYQAANLISSNTGKEFGLNPTEIRQMTDEILKGERLGSPEAMEGKALRIVNRLMKDSIAKAKTQPESYDKGPGSTTGRTSDDAFLKGWADGSIPASPANIKRAEEALSKLT